MARRCGKFMFLAAVQIALWRVTKKDALRSLAFQNGSAGIDPLLPVWGLKAVVQ